MLEDLPVEFDRTTTPSGGCTSRRELLRRTVRLGMAGALGATGLGCSNRLSCEDVSSLSTPDLYRRETEQYADESPIGPEETCSVCRFFKPGPEGECGNFKMLAGPINPGGRCNAWARA